MEGSIKVSPSLRRLILAEVGIPTVLLIFGIYHGFVQTLYRAGIIKSASFMGIEYYQGLTLHGVINAIVYTTMFAIAFGHALVAYYLRKEPNAKVAWASFWLMTVGTLMAAVPMFTGKASVLYTFYPPLKASPLFYIGAALLVVGSWLGFFSWIPRYLSWRRENPGSKTPMAIVGIFTTFIVWMIATLPLAYEVLVMLIPWSLGWVNGINVPLARALFWFFGHPLVYFWLLPAYTMYYVMLPRVAGGKLYSDFAGRLTFMLFIVLSAPVGVHHQFGEPAISTQWKWLHALLTYGVALPSFVTAFTLAASLEYAARLRGGKGLFMWWGKLPYRSQENYLFAYFFSGLILFLFGGITGILNTSYTVNAVVHNTSWVPGHFHTTVGGPVFLAFIGMTLFMVTKLTGKPVAYPRLNVWVPYLWLLGVAFFSSGLMVSGLTGEPRRTNMGLTYTNPASEAFNADWSAAAGITAFGGFIMLLSMAAYFIVFFATLGTPRRAEPALEFPTSEAYLDEPARVTTNFKPWIAAAVVVLLIAYGPTLYDVLRATFFSSVPFDPGSPAPLR
ncbi:MAG: cbb3-type cytochrome c oxidase subunit I [Candidatus Krumholzibacteria bacterium]|nr:cbb3-type cytochrome c oxidase subunit I [Candidatus Krumholzibacteria bacterium]MDH5269899.1 cbb3-type cytochrome c oxidase subunit I [Candidatus Krumholzibacteria bacterium]MDH5627984.1 cbb3-type cytochrome c oxidase subunit I [Candidatus Krumholzibacteria bacterium]